MNRRTTVITLIIVVVAAGGYYLTHWQQVRKTNELFQALLAPDDREASQAMAQLQAHGVRLYPRLVALTQSPLPRARWRSAVLLGELGNPGAGAALLGLLADPDVTTRAAAAQALGRLGVEAAVEPLAQLVARVSEPLPVRVSAARALGLLGSGDAVPQLVPALGYQPVVAEGAADDSWQLRVAAAGALGTVANSEAVRALAGRTAAQVERDSQVRTAVAYALTDALVGGGLDEQDAAMAVEALVQAAKDDNGDVRAAAVIALVSVEIPPAQESQVEPVLEQARQDPDYWVRAAAGGS